MRPRELARRAESAGGAADKGRAQRQTSLALRSRRGRRWVRRLVRRLFPATVAGGAARGRHLRRQRRRRDHEEEQQPRGWEFSTACMCAGPRARARAHAALDATPAEEKEEEEEREQARSRWHSERGAQRQACFPVVHRCATGGERRNLGGGHRLDSKTRSL